VTNQSPIPLALGSDRPISSRFVLLPKMDQVSLEAMIRPEVVDLDRRLRLMPQESITVDVPARAWADRMGDRGPGQSQHPHALASREGFIIDPESGFRPGPLGGVAETDALMIPPASGFDARPRRTSRSGSHSSTLGSLPRFVALARAHGSPAAGRARRQGCQEEGKGGARSRSRTAARAAGHH